MIGVLDTTPPVLASSLDGIHVAAGTSNIGVTPSWAAFLIATQSSFLYGNGSRPLGLNPCWGGIVQGVVRDAAHAGYQ